jgi:hypothetical protein
MRTLLMLAIALLPRSTSADTCEKYLEEDHVALFLEANAFLGRPDTLRGAARAFFGALPDSFECYKAVFDDPGPLAEAPAMQEVFPKLRTAVAERSYIRKLVRLCVGAGWQVGQIDALQDAARAALADSPSAFVRELATLSGSQEAGVWEFLFAGPGSDNDALSAGLQKRICSLSARSCDSSAEAYARSLAREGSDR